MESKNGIEWVFKDQEKRDVLVILPGGGYHFASPREAMPVAKRALAVGMHAAIFWYRGTLLKYPHLNDEGIRVLEEIRKHSKVNKLYILGFSAGAHFALMLSELRPDLIDKTILAYPVVSSDSSIRHEGSILNLLGSLDSPFLEKVSLEKQVHQQMKPVFMMHTADDQAVSVANSMRLAESLRLHNIPFELHIYPKGRHGLSLGTRDVSFEDMDPIQFEETYKDVAGWFDLAITFMKGNY